MEIHLRPDATSTTVTTALEAALVTAQAFITEPAKILAFPIRSETEPVGPLDQKSIFKLERTIYLDRFLWRRRCGAALIDNSDNEADLRGYETRIADLERRKGALANHEGHSTLALLRRSIDYFRNKSQLISQGNVEELKAEGSDSTRKQSIDNTGAKLEAVSSQLKTTIETLDAELTRESEARISLKNRMQEERAAFFDKPEWKQCAYGLRAVLVSKYERPMQGSSAPSPSSTCSFFRTAGGWWYSEGGRVERSSEESLLSIGSGQGDFSAKGEAFFLLYDREEEDDEALDLAMIPDVLKVSAGKSFCRSLLETRTDGRESIALTLFAGIH